MFHALKALTLAVGGMPKDAAQDIHDAYGAALCPFCRREDCALTFRSEGHRYSVGGSIPPIPGRADECPDCNGTGNAVYRDGCPACFSTGKRAAR